MNPRTHALALNRLPAALAAAALLAAIVVAYAHGSPGWWQLAAFGLGPDAAFLLSLDGGVERGQMSPRAVPLYNLLHRPAMPALLALLALTGVVPSNLIVGALVWAFHIALDRAVGYGLRTADGRQR